MVNWDDYASLARVVVKIYLNDDKKIPDSVKVNAGVPSKGKSWTVPCYVLKKSNVQDLPDEEAFVTMGPLHPMPAPAPRWSGPVPQLTLVQLQLHPLQGPPTWLYLVRRKLLKPRMKVLIMMCLFILILWGLLKWMQM